MRATYLIYLLVLVLSLSARSAAGQTSSLGARQRAREANTPRIQASREASRRERNRVYERYSWVAVPPKPPKTFKPGDLITIIVREHRNFEADSLLRTQNKLDLQSEITAFLKLTKGGVGAADFQRGRPNIDYKLNQRVNKRGDLEREDEFTTRITATIVDVKPNGLLVLEAKARIVHDDEVALISLTGMCRKVDVTADNTILSTQLASKDLEVNNRGALRRASSRGWAAKLFDFMNPF